MDKYDIMTAEELAAFLKVEPDLIRKKTRDRTLPHYRLSERSIRYDLTTVLDALICRGERVEEEQEELVDV